MFLVPPPATCDPTTPTYYYVFVYSMHLSGFELETSHPVVFLHLHLTTQAIVAKYRIFLVVISYWSQTPLAKTLIYLYLRGYLVHGLLSSNVDFEMATCADETVFYEKLDALKGKRKPNNIVYFRQLLR